MRISHVWHPLRHVRAWIAGGAVAALAATLAGGLAAPAHAADHAPAPTPLHVALAQQGVDGPFNILPAPSSRTMITQFHHGDVNGYFYQYSDGTLAVSADPDQKAVADNGLVGNRSILFANPWDKPVAQALTFNISRVTDKRLHGLAQLWKDQKPSYDTKATWVLAAWKTVMADIEVTGATGAYEGAAAQLARQARQNVEPSNTQLLNSLQVSVTPDMEKKQMIVTLHGSHAAVEALQAAGSEGTITLSGPGLSKDISVPVAAALKGAPVECTCTMKHSKIMVSFDGAAMLTGLYAVQAGEHGQLMSDQTRLVLTPHRVTLHGQTALTMPCHPESTPSTPSTPDTSSSASTSEQTTTSATPGHPTTTVTAVPGVDHNATPGSHATLAKTGSTAGLLALAAITATMLGLVCVRARRMNA